MTSILALDTSSDACSVALLHEGQRYSLSVNAPREHTQRLLPMIDEILSAHNLKLADLDAIAYGRGPGSFTGLRICLGIVQGLAYAADLPVIAVSTLQAMAVKARREYNLASSVDVIASLDARMNEVYWGHYNGEGLELIADEKVSPPSHLAEYITRLNIQDQLIAVGPGWHYADLQLIEKNLELQAITPQAEDVLVLAEPLWRDGCAVSAEQAQPIYLRDSVVWKKRERIRK